MPTKTPTFEQWMNGATTNKKKSSCNSHNNTPDKDFSFDLCHGNNEGSETTPERRHTNICNPSPGVINTNRRSQHVNVPIPTIRKFPNIIDEKCRYIRSGTGGYKKIRRTRKKSKKSAKHIKKIRKTVSNKKKKKK
jgi:hypothetical protein|uniref:Uncharacterized protein n=1 Tax=viral metagenome TaxID=1070528 RepID=A0A6C0J3K2_9ZZZZ